MKKITLSLLLSICVVLVVSAQDFEERDFKDPNKVQTVMNTIKIDRISGFGGPTMSFTTINGEFAHMMGGGGGIIINNLLLGGYGEGVTNTLNMGGNNNLTDFDFGHGGFWIGYEIARRTVIHPVISSRFGWGGISGYNEIESKFVNDNVFVLIPAVSAEINFTRFFKINVGAEYRRTFNVNSLTGMSDNDFSSFGVYMNFLFGWF